MKSSTARLAIALKKISGAADGLGDWAQSCDRLIPSERVALADGFARASSRAHAITGILTQPATLGVVGAPRSGKTHVIAALLANGAAPLMIKVEGITQKLNVVRQIVPVGARHMASAAIRYSSKLRPMHRGFPLSLRLLSLTEVAKILAAAHFASTSGVGATVVAADVRRLHTMIEPALSDTAVAGMTEPDAIALKDDICTRFPLHPHVQALTASGYWDSLAELAPHARLEERAQLLECLWGHRVEFTRAFERLAETLDALSFSRDAATTLDALVSPDPQTGQLIRRADSILSADSFSTLLDDGGDTIVVFNQFGQWMSVDRAALAALVAEVKFAVDGSPGSLSAESDILEFPGITSPDGLVTGSAPHDTPGQRFGRLFARAKQQLLHARAIEANEVTTLLACVDSDATGTGELEPHLTAWVHKALGTSAEARESADSGLFVVATKFDRLVNDGSKREQAIDWDAHVSTLMRGLAGGADWAAAWTPSRPFDGLSFCIAPTVKTIGLFDQGKYTGVKASLHARMARLRDAFLAAETVRRHCAAPAAAWDDALTNGDGGMLRLSKAIQDVCHTRTKQRQLLAEAGRLRETLRDSCMRYVADGGLASDRRYASALMVTRRLRHAASQRRLNRLFAALSIRDDDLAEVFQDLDGRIAVVGDAANAFFARAAIDAWITRIREVARGLDGAGLAHVPASALRHLVDELVVGANRVKLEQRIVSRIETAVPTGSTGSLRIEAASIAAATAVNGYLFTLGYDNLLANDHPRRRDPSATPIFTRLPRGDDTPDAWAADNDIDPELAQHSDWSQAYLAFVEENMRALAELTVAPEEAATLASCLGAIAETS